VPNEEGGNRNDELKHTLDRGRDGATGEEKCRAIVNIAPTVVFLLLGVIQLGISPVEDDAAGKMPLSLSTPFTPQR
jgi:hypothetical protein